MRRLLRVAEREALAAEGAEAVAKLPWWSDHKGLYINPYYEARREHAFLLRAEGRSYKEIAARLGISPTRPGQLIYCFGQQLAKSMRRTKIRIQR